MATFFVPRTAIKIPTARVENHYLETAEKNALLYLDLRHRPGLAAVRDWFLLACEVGMRFGDYEQARNPENLHEVTKDGQTVGYELHFRPSKTAKSSGVQVVAPLSRTAIQIFQRHGWRMPPTISEQVFNRSLKELAQMAGIKKDISSHDARRTFATLAYRSGMPTRAIMAVTGHKTETEFRKYLCLTADEYAEQWRQHSQEYQHHTPGLLDNPLSVAA